MSRAGGWQGDIHRTAISASDGHSGMALRAGPGTYEHGPLKKTQKAGVHGFRARGCAAPRNDILERLFPDAEVAEDDIEKVFDVDGAGDAAEAAQGETKIFGAQFRERSVKRAP